MGTKDLDVMLTHHQSHSLARTGPGSNRNGMNHSSAVGYRGSTLGHNAQHQRRRANTSGDITSHLPPAGGCNRLLGTSRRSFVEVFDADALARLQTASRGVHAAQEPRVILEPVFEPVIF